MQINPRPEKTAKCVMQQMPSTEVFLLSGKMIILLTFRSRVKDCAGDLLLKKIIMINIPKLLNGKS
jgi:hypothetical protein